MGALLSFAPILAMVAFYSIEVTAESTYSALKTGGFVNGFPIDYSIDTTPAIAITGAQGTAGATTAAGGCSVAQITADNCPLTPASWDEGNTLTATFTLPAPAALSVAPGVGAPASVLLKSCFAPPSTVNRKWRKIKDPFKKDNSCKGGLKSDKMDYAAGAKTVDMKFKSKTPTAFFAVRAYVQCADQSGDNYCHVSNFANKGDDVGPIFYSTEVMDSRPNNLFVAVFICAFIGPILLLAFLIYERGILAKKGE